jgi:hypothetical protein
MLQMCNQHVFAQNMMASITCQRLGQDAPTSTTPKMTTLLVQHQPWMKRPEEL